MKTSQFGRNLTAHIVIFVVLIRSVLVLDEDLEKKSEVLPPCQACRTLSNSFKKGVEKTSRGKYEGGDTAWEERKLGSYANSEIRLVEIQEDLCKDVSKGKHQCHSLAEENEEAIENWWRHGQKEDDFFKYFCINTLKVCCPDNYFGPNCEPCPIGLNQTCSGNGKCKGSGTRKGSGECKCDSGYAGVACDSCLDSYYQSYKDDSKLICSKCHKSCQLRCWDGGPKGCELCADGWVHNPEVGCQDLDECVERQDICGENELCVNLEGTYQCIACDKSCNGCTGDGPDMCIECKEGYILKEKVCIDVESWDRWWRIQMTRYCTYFGLCIATCIIFKKNLHVAAVVGTAVAMYIAASEYSLKDDANSLLPKFINM